MSNFTKPHVGQVLTPKRAYRQQFGRKVTVVAVVYPFNDNWNGIKDDPDIFVDDGWWIQLEGHGNEWFAQSIFESQQ